MNMGVMATINQPIDQDTAVLVVEEMGHTAEAAARRTRSRTDLQGAAPATEDARAAAAGGDRHGPRRSRQDLAARLHPPHQGGGRRGRRHHPAHRRLSRRDAQGRHHLPRHAGPRGVHRHARARRARPPTSWCWWWRPTTASCRRPSRRSSTRARPACRSWSRSTRSTRPTRIRSACAPSSPSRRSSPRSGAAQNMFVQRLGAHRRRASTSCSRRSCCRPKCSSCARRARAWPPASSSSRASRRAAARWRPCWSSAARCTLGDPDHRRLRVRPRARHVRRERPAGAGGPAVHAGRGARPVGRAECRR